MNAIVFFPVEAIMLLTCCATETLSVAQVTNWIELTKSVLIEHCVCWTHDYHPITQSISDNVLNISLAIIQKCRKIM